MKNYFDLKYFVCSFSILFLATFLSHAQEQADVYYTSTYLSFDSQTLSSIDGYVKDPANLEFSKYGGWKAHQVQAKGYFYVEKMDGRWWAVDPEGYLYIHKAPNTINLDNHTGDEIYEFLGEYGFNGMGCWSDEDILSSSLKETTPMAYCPKISFIALYRRGREPRIEMPVFDDEFETYCNDKAKEFLPYVDDPHVFGYMTDNELPWRDDGLSAHLALSDQTDKNYITAINFLSSRGKTVDNWDDDDRDAYMALMAERYYSVVSAAIRSVDQNHMIIGSRCHSNERMIEDFMTNAGKYVDVFSINYYNRWGLRQFEIQNMTEWSGRPLMITEFYAMQVPGYNSSEGAGWKVLNQKSRALLYQNFVSTLLEAKCIVGFHWFRFEDDDSNINKGLVSEDGTTYDTLLSSVKEMNTYIYDYVDYLDSKVFDVVLRPEADAYFKGEENYGSDPELLVKNSSSTAYARETYLRFNLSTLDTSAQAAVIKLHSIATGSEAGAYEAQLVIDNSWEENGIIASNKPAGSTVLKSWGQGDDVSIDVTEQLNDAIENEKKLSICIVATYNNGKVPSYGSREHENPHAQPELQVKYNMNSAIRGHEKLVSSVFPNPSEGEITIGLNTVNSLVTASVYTCDAQLIQSKTFSDKDQIKLNVEGPAGVYLVKLCADGNEECLIKIFRK